MRGLLLTILSSGTLRGRRRPAARQPPRAPACVALPQADGMPCTLRPAATAMLLTSTQMARAAAPSHPPHRSPSSAQHGERESAPKTDPALIAGAVSGWRARRRRRGPGPSRWLGLSRLREEPYAGAELRGRRLCFAPRPPLRGAGAGVAPRKRGGTVRKTEGCASAGAARRRRAQAGALSAYRRGAGGVRFPRGFGGFLGARLAAGGGAGPRRLRQLGVSCWAGAERNRPS
jgi:hypothetical protein